MLVKVVFGVVLSVLQAASAAPRPPHEWNIRNYGAVADGRTDDTPGFQRALDAAAKAGGGVVSVPTGEYCIRGTLRIPGGVTLQGAFRSAPSSAHETRPRMDGTVLQAYAGRGDAASAPFITMAGSNATLCGVIVTYPEWKQSDVPPVPYPPTVYADYTENVSILDCCLVNSYEAIHFQNAGRFLVRNVTGYPSFRGLYVDMCGDIGRVENCHFWPFSVNYTPEDPYCRWVNTQGVAFEFARTDWQYVLNTFCFGYGVGYKFSESKNGSCNGNFVGIGADCCERPVVVEQLQLAGLLITNGEFVGRWGSLNAVGLEIAPGAGEGKVSLANCSFWGPSDRCIWSRSPKTALSVIGTNFCNFNFNNADSPAIQLDAGKAIVQGNTFGEGETHVRVAAAVAAAIVSGNLADGGLTVDNQAGARAQVFGNEAGGVALTDAGREHYRVAIGTQGDRPYLRKWHGRESATEWPNAPGTKRWGTSESELILPVHPKTRYTVTLDLYVPGPALDPENGVYLGETKLAALPEVAGPATVTCAVPKSRGNSVVLTLRVKGWRPREVIAGSIDGRLLGVAARSVEMKADGASGKVFDANTGN